MFKKIFLASLLSAFLLIGSSYDVLAAKKSIEVGTTQTAQESYVDENGTHYVMAPLSKEEQIKEIKSYLLEKYKLKSLDNIVIEVEKPSIAPDTVSQDNIGSVTKKVDLGRVGGQTSSVTFDNGGYIYWQDGGASTSVGFSIGGGIYSMDVSIGYVASGVTGYGMWCNPGEATLMGLEKTVKFTRACLKNKSCTRG